MVQSRKHFSISNLITPLRHGGPLQSRDNGHTMHFHSWHSASTEHTFSKQQTVSVHVKHSLISVFPYFSVFIDWPLC